MEKSYEVIPEPIRNKLKKYKRLRTITCLECGYTGLAGIKANYAWLLWLAFCLMLFIGAFFVGLIYLILIALVGGFLIASFNNKLVVCPSCDRDLKVK